MHTGQYVFQQIVSPIKRQFNRIVERYDDRTKGWAFTHWNHLLVLIFGQLTGCCTLRELADVINAHAKRSYHLGFGKVAPGRNIISKSNTLRDYRIYEDFAFYMVGWAQRLRITKEFELHGRFYAVDSTTIDLCLAVFRWAKFRTTKSGIKIHTQIDIVTEIPVFYRISNASISDFNSMDWLQYEALACYVFDRGYFDLARLFAIEKAGAFFIIREKSHPDYVVVEGEDILDGEDNVLRDQTVRFTGKRNKGNYPTPIRRIVYYAPDLKRTFTYYTNNLYLKASDIALLYKYRWQVELFFKWIKQHLKVKSFWGESENAVRIQIHVAIITYCLMGIIEHEHQVGRPIIEVMRILGHSLLVTDDIDDLLKPARQPNKEEIDGQLYLDFNID